MWDKINGELIGRCGRKGADGVPVRSNGIVSVISIVWCDANGVFEEAFSDRLNRLGRLSVV